MTKRNYASFDIAKLFCALLVIIIHTRPLARYSDVADFYLTDVLARFAVPLFFAMSGYLFFGKLLLEDGKIKRCAENRARLLHYLKRIGVLYVAWSAVYLLYQLPQWRASGWWGLYVMKDYFVSFLFSGSYYHLWYLLALLYAVPLLYFVLTFERKDKIIWVCVAGWVTECLLYSYRWIGIDDIEALTWLTSRFDILFCAAFRAVPLLGIGALCIDGGVNTYKWRTWTIASFVACVFEASMLYFFSPNEGHYSYLICTPIFTYCGLNWLLNIDADKIDQTKRLFCRHGSLVIYCAHPLVIGIYDQLTLPDGLLRWGIVTVVSIVIAFVWVHITNSKRDFGRA